jgi:hypothetical protein
MGCFGSKSKKGYKKTKNDSNKPAKEGTNSTPNNVSAENKQQDAQASKDQPSGVKKEKSIFFFFLI